MIKIKNEDVELITKMYDCLDSANEETLAVLKSINKVLAKTEIDRRELETVRDNLYSANEKIARMCGKMHEAWQDAD